MKDVLTKLVGSKFFKAFVVFVIMLNAAIIGFETIRHTTDIFHESVFYIDDICIAFFLLEISLKIFVKGGKFFKSGWNVFDLSIILISTASIFMAYPALKIISTLRILMLMDEIPSLKIIVGAILKSLPSIGWVGFLLFIDYYVFAVIGTMFFGKTFPAYFGSVGISLFTLFQMMTLDDWSNIAKQVVVQHPFAYIYFVIFILSSAFVILNVVIGIVCNSVNELKDREQELAKIAKSHEVPDVESKLEIVRKHLTLAAAQLSELELVLDAKTCEAKEEFKNTPKDFDRKLAK